MVSGPLSSTSLGTSFVVFWLGRDRGSTRKGKMDVHDFCLPSPHGNILWPLQTNSTHNFRWLVLLCDTSSPYAGNRDCPLEV